MKRAFIMILVSLLIFGLSSGCAFVMHGQSHELMGMGESILSNIGSGENEKALQELYALQGKYDKYSLFWQTTIEHSTIEQVSEHISTLESDLLYDVAYMARRDCALLICALEGINESLWPHFGNIL